VTHKFSTLDGLRGVAAISVMAYHRRDWFGGNEFLGHAFLAVDFFFLLSGFVLAHAYSQRLTDQRDVSIFIRERIIRLHPMLVAGAILAILVAFVDAYKADLPFVYFATFALSHMVPFPVLWGSLPAAFPWNIAIWSLFWELLANLLFAFLAPWLTIRTLIAIVVVNIVTMIFVSFSVNGFQVGFARDPSQFIWGFPRVCASFFFGILIYKTHVINSYNSKFVSIICTCLLILTFCAVSNNSSVSYIYDPLIAYGVYPILLVVAARVNPTMPRVAALLGAISYPLYIIHEPMLKVVGGLLRLTKLSNGFPNEIEAILRLSSVIGLAFFILKIYDEPVRSMLRRWLKRSHLR